MFERMQRLLIFFVLVFFPACSHGAAVQDALDAYHVVADASGGGVAVLSARAFALSGEAGAAVRVTASVDASGTRATVLERKLDEAGVLAWSVELRPGGGPAKLLRMTRIDCAQARALLPDLPVCPPLAKSAGSPKAPEVIERVVYPAQRRARARR